LEVTKTDYLPRVKESGSLGFKMSRSVTPPPALRSTSLPYGRTDNKRAAALPFVPNTDPDGTADGAVDGTAMGLRCD
jgi:hypothetical protein